MMAIFSACVEDGLVELVELGAPVKEYITPAERSAIEIPVYANGRYTATFVEDVDWADMAENKGSRDGSLYIMCARNDGFKRSVKLLLESNVDSRVDTVLIKQQGTLSETLYMSNTSLILDGNGGSHSEEISVNLPLEDVTLDVSEDWVQSCSIQEGESRMLVVTSVRNEDEIAPRTATMNISYVDGWGETMTLTLNLVQRNSSGGLGREISLAEFKSEYAVNSEQITDYVIIEGVVVSNQESGNVAENEQLTPTSIDKTGSPRSIYLQNPEGTHGVKIMTVSEKDNTFAQFDKVQILLHGATTMVYEDPERYVIEGVTSSMIVSHQSGSKEDIAVKEKTVAQLTDTDIYTYVTLKDVGFSVRKGSLVPINNAYAVGGNNRFNTFPALMHDAEGNSIYMLTNTTCKYRGNGDILPYGTGKASGVIVHERFPRFEWKNAADPLDMEIDPELGRMGTYQLRHQSREDIYAGLPGSVEDGPTALLTEYRFWNPDVSKGVLLPTYGTNGYLRHTYDGDAYNSSNDPEKSIRMVANKYSYSYLGPIGGKIGNFNGCGVILDPDNDKWTDQIGLLKGFVSTNNDGTIEWCGPTSTNGDASTSLPKGALGINYSGNNHVPGDTYMTFASNNWWNYTTDRPYAWMVNVSTKNLTTTALSLQLAAYNHNSAYYAPRYWKVEWATTDSMDPADDSKWTLVGKFTIPDISQNTDPKFFTTSGSKHVHFKLPLDMLGKNNVYIRIMPENDICSGGTEYADATLRDVDGSTKTNIRYSILEYLAIRYTK